MGNVACIRHDVGAETARVIEALVADEPPFSDPAVPPVHLDEYVQLLGAEAPVGPPRVTMKGRERDRQGMIYSLPNRTPYPHEFMLVSSDSPSGDRLLAELMERGMPLSLVEAGFTTTDEFWPPWCLALERGEIASIAFAVRLGPLGAEVGVYTFPRFRGRGFAAAVTAGWASHPALEGRALFYSTDLANVSSQRVAGRLGLRLIGASLRLT